MHKSGIILVFVIVLSCHYGMSQSVNGIVVDQAGDEIPGAYVNHLGSDQHTHTNEHGEFFIKQVKVRDTLEVRHIGFETVQFIVRDLNRSVEIKMTESLLRLSEVVVEKSTNSLSLLRRIDLVTNPVNSSQELLRKIPGLFIAQHSGGGKAEQIFLRGFDLDHGTDINITVDGLPVNMVSHAHGQGYSDLHFLIPETVEAIDFSKGPYQTNKGNFTTAGYVDFKTKQDLDQSLISVKAGQFNTLRTVGLFDMDFSENSNGYVAAEYLGSNGPFDNPQDLTRINLVGKFTSSLDDNQGRISATLMHFDSKWDASGLIPPRAVESGMISRFGSIDPTQGGETRRTSAILEYDRAVNELTFLKNRVYYSAYDFDLFSNFSFYMNDPVNGDRIRQREDRTIFGFNSELTRTTYVSGKELELQVGIGLRNDLVDDLLLSDVIDRYTAKDTTQLGDVNELNAFTYLNAELEIGKWLLNGGLRLDYFDFQYRDHLGADYQPQTRDKARVSPKLNFIYHHSSDLQFYVKSGIGFHSNDTRVSVTNQREVLPAAYGVDLGTIWKPIPRLVADVAFWYLFLDQEFVYVGDEGVVEPSGRSRRTGVDVGLRYQLSDWLFADADFNYSRARSVDESEFNQFIPLAPEITAMGSINVIKGNFTAGIQTRYLSDRPANEDNSLVAEGYVVTDLNLGYNLNKIHFQINVENLFDQEWKEAQFAVESQLQSETQPVEEVHFIPGTPLFVTGSIQYTF